MDWPSLSGQHELQVLTIGGVVILGMRLIVVDRNVDLDSSGNLSIFQLWFA